MSNDKEYFEAEQEQFISQIRRDFLHLQTAAARGVETGNNTREIRARIKEAERFLSEIKKGVERLNVANTVLRVISNAKTPSDQ